VAFIFFGDALAVALTKILADKPIAVAEIPVILIGSQTASDDFRSEVLAKGRVGDTTGTQ
jgi:hypothetical protein